MAVDDSSQTYEIGDDVTSSGKGDEALNSEPRKWSDVVFLAAYGRPSNFEGESLRSVFQMRVTNKVTKMVLETILKREGRKNGRVEVGRDLIVGPEAREWHTLMGTPNVSGVCWLLIQHREDMGRKIVKNIRVFLEDELKEYMPSLMFEIEDLVDDQISKLEAKGRKLAEFLDDPAKAPSTIFLNAGSTAKHPGDLSRYGYDVTEAMADYGHVAAKLHAIPGIQVGGMAKGRSVSCVHKYRVTVEGQEYPVRRFVSCDRVG